MRIAGVETPWWRTQGPGVPGPSGAVGEPGDFDASGQNVVKPPKLYSTQYTPLPPSRGVSEDPIGE